MDESGNSSSVLFVETPVPNSWHRLETFCSSSNGHLVSLESKSIENQLTQKSILADFWCGGNMCTDSPGEFRKLIGLAQIWLKIVMIV